jgi:hypothetical protein
MKVNNSDMDNHITDRYEIQYRLLSLLFKRKRLNFLKFKNH